jgi:hypothetical protein
VIKAIVEFSQVINHPSQFIAPYPCPQQPFDWAVLALDDLRAGLWSEAAE